MHSTIQFLLHELRIFNNKKLECGLTILILGLAAGLEIDENMCKIVHVCAIQYTNLSLDAVSDVFETGVLRPHTITIATIRAVYAP